MNHYNLTNFFAYFLGIIDKKTFVYVDPDDTPEYRRIHVVPFRDTLPRAYEFNIFRDYLKPYFQQNYHMKFRKDDRFTFQGVQFKVSCSYVV